jgi:hypothetical protein
MKSGTLILTTVVTGMALVGFAWAGEPPTASTDVTQPAAVPALDDGGHRGDGGVPPGASAGDAKAWSLSADTRDGG